MRRRVVWAVLATLVGLVLYVSLHDQLSFAALVSHEGTLREYQHRHPIVVLPIAFVLYIVASWIPITKGKAIIYGWLFGFSIGFLVVDLAAMTAAILPFWASRHVFGAAIERRLGRHRNAIERRIQRHGSLYLFELRLIPVVPALILALAMGITKMRSATYCWYSQFGMLPIILTCVYAGSHVPHLKDVDNQGWAAVASPQLIAALVVLAILPLATRKVLPRLRRRGRFDEV